MQIINIEQGTQEWLDARSGFLSASKADVLFTPTGKPAKGAKIEDYLNKLIAERLMGKSAESGFTSEAMLRGIELEDQARSWYEMATGYEVTECGLVTTGGYSCSPDGLIVNDGAIVSGVEIKCPLAHTHIGYVRSGKMPTKYIPQVQASMFVCDVVSWDFLSYHPDLEPLLIKVERDDEWIEGFVKVGEEFLFKLIDEVENIQPHTKAA